MNEAQRKALVILPKVSASLSLLGSGMIVFSILRNSQKMAKSYHRLLLGMSLTDSLVSSSLFLSTWPMLEDSGYLWAAGNTATCTATGFIAQLYLTSSLYSVSLAIYYTLVLRYDWTEERVRRVEPFLHAVPLLSGFGTGIVGISLKIFNPAGLWCWIASWPAGCEGEECIRGVNAKFYQWAFFYVPLWISIVFVTIAMFMVWFDVRRRAYDGADGGPRLSVSGTESSRTRTMCSVFSSKREEQRSEQALQDDDADEDAYDKNDSFLLEDKAAERDRLTRKIKRDVAFQGFLYSGSFYVTWACPTSVRLLQILGEPAPYKLVASMSFFAPIQGFFNMLVYLFPKFMAVKKAHPEHGILRWIYDSIF